MGDLSRLLRPKSIAVLGSGWAQNVIEQCGRMGFAGDVWPVHPTRAEIGGLTAYPSLSALPASPDAAFLGVNRHATLDVVSELSAMGGGGAVVFASGWAETGDRSLQSTLIDRAGPMPFLGPNCYGLINYLDGAIIWPDQHGGTRQERGVAIISQSSNIAINLTMQARGLPVAYVACLGNAARIGLADLAEALGADERVTALGLYVEGVDDAAALARVAEDLRAAGKEMVVVKSGKSEAGATAAASHTASLAGSYAASSAFFRQAGIGEVDTLAALIETLKILHVHGRLPGRRICSLSCSGGEAGLVADLGARTGLRFPAPEPDQSATLSDLLGPRVTIANPLDYQTYIWGDRETTTAVFAEMLKGYDAGIVLLDPPRPDCCDPSSFIPSLDAIEAAAGQTGVPAFPVASMPENFDEALASGLIAQGTVPLMGLETALEAIEAASAPPGTDGWRPLAVLADAATARLLPEDEAKAFLASAGVPVPKGVSAAAIADLDPRTAGILPPYVLKGLGFAHKSEAGAVLLGLSSLDGQQEMVGAAGYLVEEMVAGGVAELLVGLMRDPVYGATLTLGLGGVTAELLADTVTLVLPVGTDDIGAALRRLRLWPLLDGYRGRPKPDLVAAIDVIERLARLFETDPSLVELEVNPLILTPSRAVAADALIRKETA